MYEEPNQFEWLVIGLVYNHKHYDEIYKDVPGYITMEVQKDHLFTAIEDIKYNDKIKVILVENRLSFNKEEGEVAGVKEIINVVEKTDDEKLNPVVNKNPSFVESFTDAASMTTILKAIRNYYPANRCIVITVGHGSIFGINLITSECSNQNKYNKKSVKEEGKKQYLSASWLNKLYDGKNSSETSFFMNEKVRSLQVVISKKAPIEEQAKEVNKSVFLSNKELAEVIAQVWPEKLDILVMYNCLMQNVYTQYELRKCVDYFVAPVSGICYPGYNYSGVLDRLAKNVRATNEEVANLFLVTIRRQKKFKEFKRDIEGTWKITTMQLDEKVYDEIKAGFTACIEDALQLQKQKPEILFMCINNTLNQCFNYAHICLNNEQTEIDLLVFLKYLKEQIETGFPSCAALIYKLDPLIKTMEGINCKSFIGKLYFPKEIGFIDTKYAAGGKPVPSFGFVFQKTEYPDQTIQDFVLSKNKPNYYPSFLENTNFQELFEELAAFNRVVNLEQVQ